MQPDPNCRHNSGSSQAYMRYRGTGVGSSRKNANAQVRNIALASSIKVLGIFVIVVCTLVWIATSGTAEEPESAASRLAVRKNGSADIVSSVGSVNSMGAAMSSNSSSSKPEPSKAEEKGEEPEITSGTLPDSDIPYYKCHSVRPASATAVTTHETVVLLHGARFTKEGWKKSGIMASLCKSDKLDPSKTMTVWALDLSVQSDHVVLQYVLEGIKKLTGSSVNDRVTVVTPSASGRTVISWIEAMTSFDSQQTPSITSYVSRWIPFACPGIQELTQQQLKNWTILIKGARPPFAILAGYGNQDSMGKMVSVALANFASAKLLELNGGHPAYFQSPNDFVFAVIRFINNN